MAFFEVPNTKGVIGAVNEERRRAVGGIYTLSMNFGMVAGTILALTVFNMAPKLKALDLNNKRTFSSSLFMEGFHMAVTICIIIALATFVLYLVSSIKSRKELKYGQKRIEGKA
jgi:hypothetical protein